MAKIRFEGKVSTFGGPDDTGVTPSEGLALIQPAHLSDTRIRALFLPDQPPGTTGLARRLDPDKHYIACRWDYQETPKPWLRQHTVSITNLKTGTTRTAQPVDFGPHRRTGRVADLSPGLARALGVETDEEVVVEIDRDAPARGRKRSLSREARVLVVHGVGHHSGDVGVWQQEWLDAVTEGFEAEGFPLSLVGDAFLYDHVFDEFIWQLTPWDRLQGMSKLAWNLVRPQTRQLTRGPLSSVQRIFAAMEEAGFRIDQVLQWIEFEEMRDVLRDMAMAKIKEFEPDLILAHSMGSLVLHDTVLDAGTRAPDVPVVYFGSQVGNRATWSAFGGLLQMPRRGQFFQLFNPKDRVFTEPIRGRFSNFERIETLFDAPDILNHSSTRPGAAFGYLDHPDARPLWTAIGRSLVGSDRSVASPADRSMSAPAIVGGRAAQRALLIGVNEYAKDSITDLGGCVNDTYLASKTLQQCGFEADSIRLLHDRRATANAIRSRLDWLFDGVRPGDQRVLHFSGHGTRLRNYDLTGNPNRFLECLCPHDFDWREENAIIDLDLIDYYSQLSKESRVILIFDCCHSGGLTREGGKVVRGLSAPQDIAHRDLSWDDSKGRWTSRPATELFSGSFGDSYRRRHSDTFAQYFGANGSTERLGRAALLRDTDWAVYSRARRRLDHEGPYLPLILMACGEDQLASEHRDGAESYGVFTYALFNSLKRKTQGESEGEAPSFEALLWAAAEEIDELGYEQVPEIFGPKSRQADPVPFVVAPATTPPPSRRRKTKRQGRPRAVHLDIDNRLHNITVNFFQKKHMGREFKRQIIEGLTTGSERMNALSRVPMGKLSFFPPAGMPANIATQRIRAVAVELLRNLGLDGFELLPGETNATALSKVSAILAQKSKVITELINFLENDLLIRR